MAEVQVLKEISVSILSSKKKERKYVFEQLEKISETEVPAQILKVICRLLQLTLPRYSDRKSSQVVTQYVQTLVKKQPSSSTYLIKLIFDVAETYKNAQPTKAIAQICLSVLNWSCYVAISTLNNDDLSSSDLESLLTSQSYLLYTLTGVRSNFLIRKAYKILSLTWKQSPEGLEAYESNLKSLKESTYTLTLYGFFIKFLIETKQKDVIDRNKAHVLDMFVKCVIGTKIKPEFHFLESCQPILKQVSHEDFRSILLPSLQKALLRNAEVILETVGYVVSSIPIDLSQYALELGKTLGAHLHSKEEESREEAVEVCKFLAQQSSSSQAIEDLLKHFFGILNGSEGKLTVAAQRMGVLSGIGNLSYNTVTGSSSIQNTCEIATDHFIAVLKHEVHEGTITHTISMLSLWCARYTTAVPKSLMEWFKAAFGLKTSTSSVRTSYLYCMNAAFHGNTLHYALDMIPLLVKVAEKILAQPVQLPTISEGLVAYYLLLRLFSFDLETENKLKSIVNTEVEKLPFFSEKFLMSASEQALQSVMFVIEKLLLEHSHNISDRVSFLHKAIICILMKPSFKLRQQASISVKKLLSTNGGAEMTSALLKEFSCVVEKVKIKGRSDSDAPESESSAEVSPQVLVNCLFVLCSHSNLLTEEANLIAIEAFLPCHIPELYEHDPILWLRLLRKMGITVKEFVDEAKDQLLISILDGPNTPAVRNSLKTLSRLLPEDLSTAVISHSCAIFSSAEFVQVTRREYDIFQTPEGQLFDTSVIENLKENTTASKNIKRESKLYSYKEQLEEIEMKKELEAKKRAKGLTKAPELTKKQLEAKAAQLVKESAIRENMQCLHSKFQHSVNLLRALIEGNPRSLGIHIKTITPILISLFSSALCAEEAVALYVDLADAVSNELMRTWGKPIAYVVLRLLEPMCELQNGWTEMDLNDAISKMIEMLHLNTCQSSDNNYEEYQEIDSQSRLPGPGFAYCFPLLHQILLKRSTNVALVERTLEIIVEHMDIRHTDPITDKKYQDYLPLMQILDVLIKVISQSSGNVQSLAVKALLKTCSSANGGDDCTIAEVPEIHILLMALMVNDKETRLAALKGLQELELVIPTPDVEYEAGMLVTRRIFIAAFDPEEENREIAKRLWNNLCLEKNFEMCDLILEDILHEEILVRQSAAEALADILSNFTDCIPPILIKLMGLYKEKLYLPPPVLDDLHRVVCESPPDKWEGRSGIALALGKMAPFLDQKKVSELMGFFVPEGLSDRHSIVAKHMLEAAIAVVDAHGKESLNLLLPVFEDFLDQAPNSSSYDAVRQSVVILMGTLARHLEKDDPKVKPIIVKLIEALSTPSQQVQEAVANCLPPLVPSIKDEVPKLVDTLLQLLLESDRYGERKGAAYGLAGLVKGLGILSLKQLNIMNTLTTAIQNKKNSKHREGALFAFEMLCNMLGRLFEPYVVNFLPHLLNCFGDGNQYVREATDDTARAVMSRLSAHGVKLVLPSLIRALAEDSWRTKTGSIELLGAMAYCAPKQLSSCLPSIVPKLIEVLSDSHMKVQNAGAQALRQIGSVIRNPEIQAIVPTLLDALQDPTKKTSPCLAALLDTRFVHFIDAPSLALIMPVVERAFQDRSTETRKMAAQIIGNMYSLTDQKDLAPYLPNIIPGLKQSLLDPVPEVRSVSARALGTMVRGMGESSFDHLMPWLMQTLTAESSSVDRSGAAQGLSEVVGGLGVEKLKTFMPEIIVTAERTDIAPHVKDGYIMMFIYLPMVFKKEFTPYIGNIITPILKALADENEYVRDTALKAGQRIVTMYADTAIMLLLPELEQGLFDDNWRIRSSSIQLLGDLLYKISGVSGKMTTETADEDDNFGTEQSNKLILGSLGYERRNRVLAGLYMGRSDVALMVRQSALHVWKVVVTNTPRTLREILPTLFSLLLGCLASNSYDKRQVAARTLGDLVRKLGERVLPEIIPILEQGLDSDRSDQRQGVCIGLSEIMASTSRDMVLTFVDSLVPTVRRALCDPLPEVRQAAATTFDSLHSTVGVRALDEILPPLLKLLNNPQYAEYTLDGLRQVLAIKSKVVLPYLVPQLTTPPINTKALSFLSVVAGEALTKHLPKILPALLSALTLVSDTPEEQQVLEHCQSVVLAVTDDLGVRTVLDYLLEASKSNALMTRRAATALLCTFCCQNKLDISQYVPQLLRGLIRLFTDHDPKVLQLSWEALNAVTKNLNSSAQLKHVPDVRQAVRFAASDLKDQELLPGFCLPKGLSPILPIFREAVLSGVAEEKEQAAKGLGEVIRLTSGDALKPSVIHITGPLIRILGDRFSWTTKVAILETLSLLLAKVGPMLRPFLPQLQTTFLRALSDGHRHVRLKSAEALSYLILVHSRCDTLFAELLTAVKNAEDNSLKETMFHALRCVLFRCGDKMSDEIRSSITATVTAMVGYADDDCRIVGAACLGTLCKFPDPELDVIIREHLLDDDLSVDWILRHGRSIALMVALKEAPDRMLSPEWAPRIVKTLMAYLTADRVAITLVGVRSCGYYFLHQLQNNEPVPQSLLSTFAKSMNHAINEVKQTIALTVNYIARTVLLPGYVMKTLVPHLVNGTKEKNSIVKSNSEYALITLLQLRKGDEVSESCLSVLDPGAREALLDVIMKVLKRVASQPELKEEDLDDTFLT